MTKFFEVKNMATTWGAGGDTIQNGKLDREKENVLKNIRKKTIINMQEKLANGATSKETVNRTIGSANMKVTTKHVFHLVMIFFRLCVLIGFQPNRSTLLFHCWQLQF